jgi:molybdopterin-guanine dinucleotide biosynthesis protein A
MCKRLPETITGFILAGGQSRRMGEDKALLRLGSEYLIDRPIRALQAVTSDVRIIGLPERYSQFGLPVIPDCVESRGPLSGIYTALKTCPTPHALLLACDMPLICPDFCSLLLRKRPRADVVLVRFDDGFIEPLCSLYSRSCLPIIEASLSAGRLKIADFFERVTVSYVDEQELSKAGLRRNIFSNINTREEFRQLINQVAQPER